LAGEEIIYRIKNLACHDAATGRASKPETATRYLVSRSGRILLIDHAAPVRQYRQRRRPSRAEEPAVTDPEREHFARQVHDLEGRLRRWQLIAFVLAALLLVPVVGAGLMGAVLGPRTVRQRAALEQALQAERQAREAAAQQREETDKALQRADKVLQEGTRPGRRPRRSSPGRARGKSEPAPRSPARTGPVTNRGTDPAQ
jgi:hypothetical protein